MPLNTPGQIQSWSLFFESNPQVAGAPTTNPGPQGVFNRDGTAGIRFTSSGMTITGTAAFSGVFTLANGTAAAPSLAFTNSATTGLYRNASNVIGVAIAGVAALAVGGSAPTIAAATTAAGQDVYIKTADAGPTGVAVAGGAYNLAAGAGSAGSSGTGTTAGGVGGALLFTSGAGGSATSTAGAAGGAGGANGVVAGAGGSAAGTSNAGAGGAASTRGGAGGAKTGTGTANGGAGGSSLNIGGAGGATAATAGTASGGRGGAAGLTAGAGGNASAGTANGGHGGSVPLTPGMGGTSFGGTAGNGGIVYVAGQAPMPFCKNQTISALADSDATVGDADMRGGIWTVAAGATNRTKTTTTAAAIVTAFPSIQVGSVIEITICNLKAANTVTLAGGSGVTAPAGVNLVVAAQAAVTFKLVATNVTASSEAFSIIRAAG